jgi:hypothetical protein
VGRFNSTADDVTQPLEIKHQNSGERITLDSSGLGVQKVNDDRLYAGAFSGTDADTRLSNCLSAAPTGATVFLEKAKYSQDITVSKPVSLIGLGGIDDSTVFEGTMTMTLAANSVLKGVRCSDDTVNIVITSSDCLLQNITAFGPVGSKAEISVDSSSCRLIGLRGMKVVLGSNSLRCVVDSSSSLNIIDNGSGNTIGDNT